MLISVIVGFRGLITLSRRCDTCNMAYVLIWGMCRGSGDFADWPRFVLVFVVLDCVVLVRCPWPFALCFYGEVACELRDEAGINIPPLELIRRYCWNCSGLHSSEEWMGRWWVVDNVGSAVRLTLDADIGVENMCDEYVHRLHHWYFCRVDRVQAVSSVVKYIGIWRTVQWNIV
jgi:hypothetical protein